MNAAGIAAEVAQDEEHRFLMGWITQLLGNLLHAAGGAIAEQLLHLLLQIEDRRCRLLAGLNTWLVIGIDINQFAIEANGTLKQRD